MVEPLSKPRRIPLVDGPAPTLYLYGDILNEVRFNGGWQPERRACGLLVGRHYRTPEGDATYVECEGFVAGAHVVDLADFTRDLRMQWKAAAGVVRSQFGDAELIGWYTAAPGMGPPTEDALVLHNSFFNHPWQTGLWFDLDGDPVAIRTAGGVLETAPVGVL